MKDETLLFVCMELCDGGDLCWLIDNRQNIQLSESRNMFTQIAMGVSYLHNKFIMHRDLKVYVLSSTTQMNINF
jgi:serine/threonine protein kinase